MYAQCCGRTKWKQPAQPEGAGDGFPGKVVLEMAQSFLDGAERDRHHRGEEQHVQRARGPSLAGGCAPAFGRWEGQQPHRLGSAGFRTLGVPGPGSVCLHRTGLRAPDWLPRASA